MWWVTPDGTVYLYPPWEHPPGTYEIASDEDWGESLAYLPQQPRSPLDDLMRMRESEARIKHDEAKASYWEAKANNERRKGWGL